MCIDICPVGALTSGAYRYKTRPWEMNHVGTICTHCGDGCKTTLGVRRCDTGAEIVRGDNRDKSGINGDFLCVKGRYAFDFVHHKDRLTQPLIRKNGKLTPATWEEAFELIGKRFREVRDEVHGESHNGGSAIGVIGSNRTTNEENYLLSKFARVVLKTNNVDHHRTADYPALAAALHGKPGKTASMRDVLNSTCDSADWQRSDESASAAGLADPYECAVTAREALCHQLRVHQVTATGGSIRIVAGGRGSEGSRISRRRRFPARCAGERWHERAMPGLRCARKFAPNRTWLSFSVLNCAVRTWRSW